VHDCVTTERISIEVSLKGAWRVCSSTKTQQGQSCALDATTEVPRSRRGICRSYEYRSYQESQSTAHLGNGRDEPRVVGGRVPAAVERRGR
jgi:hypothetical protein